MMDDDDDLPILSAVSRHGTPTPVTTTPMVASRSQSMYTQTRLDEASVYSARVSNDVRLATSPSGVSTSPATVASPLPLDPFYTTTPVPGGEQEAAMSLDHMRISRYDEIATAPEILSDTMFTPFSPTPESTPSSAERLTTGTSPITTSRLEKLRAHSSLLVGASSESPDDATPPNLARFEWKDWNGEFQEQLEREDSYDKHRKLVSLAHDFVYAATTYGKIIIAERHLPESRKTIKPVSFGGVAGGEKFVCHSIFFKFATDNQIPVEGHDPKSGEEYKGDTIWMYGGKQRDDAAAMKAAAHDLKGLISFYNTKVEGIRFPLMALISYRGYRLVAMSILPIGKCEDGFGGSTLCYGSDDGGRSVVTSNLKFNTLMKQMGEMLNLKQHRVMHHDIYGPADIEGHVGIDGKFYLLDFARTFPPEAPHGRSNEEGSRTIFYQHLRPEFLRRYPKPLSSDAFSGFGVAAQAEHNTEVLEATEYLYRTVIPAFAEKLDRHCERVQVEGANAATSTTRDDFLSLTAGMHRHGVNVRHCGRVRRHCKNHVARTRLLTEMVVRAQKNHLNLLQRHAMHANRNSYHEPTTDIILRFLALVLGGQAQVKGGGGGRSPKLSRSREGECDLLNVNTKTYWCENVKQWVDKHFPRGLTADELDPEYDLRQGINRATWFKRLQESTGITLSKRLAQEVKLCEICPTLAVMVLPSDLISIEARVSHLNVIDEAEANALFYEAQNYRGPQPDQLWRLVNVKFAKAVKSWTHNHFTLYQWGSALFEQAKQHEGCDSDPRYESASDLLKAAEEKLYQAVNIHPKFTAAWFQLGHVLIESGCCVANFYSPHQRQFFLRAYDCYKRAMIIDESLVDQLASIARKRLAQSQALAVDTLESGFRSQESRQPFFLLVGAVEQYRVYLRWNLYKTPLPPPEPLASIWQRNAEESPDHDSGLEPSPGRCSTDQSAWRGCRDSISSKLGLSPRSDGDATRQEELVKSAPEARIEDGFKMVPAQSPLPSSAPRTKAAESATRAADSAKRWFRETMGPARAPPVDAKDGEAAEQGGFMQQLFAKGIGWRARSVPQERKPVPSPSPPEPSESEDEPPVRRTRMHQITEDEISRTPMRPLLPTTPTIVFGDRTEDDAEEISHSISPPIQMERAKGGRESSFESASVPETNTRSPALVEMSSSMECVSETSARQRTDDEDEERVSPSSSPRPLGPSTPNREEEAGGSGADAPQDTPYVSPRVSAAFYDLGWALLLLLVHSRSGADTVSPLLFEAAQMLETYLLSCPSPLSSKIPPFLSFGPTAYIVQRKGVTYSSGTCKFQVRTFEARVGDDYAHWTRDPSPSSQSRLARAASPPPPKFLSPASPVRAEEPRIEYVPKSGMESQLVSMEHSLYLQHLCHPTGNEDMLENVECVLLPNNSRCKLSSSEDQWLFLAYPSRQYFVLSLVMLELFEESVQAYGTPGCVEVYICDGRADAAVKRLSGEHDWGASGISHIHMRSGRPLTQRPTLQQIGEELTRPATPAHQPIAQLMARFDRLQHSQSTDRETVFSQRITTPYIGKYVLIRIIPGNSGDPFMVLKYIGFRGFQAHCRMSHNVNVDAAIPAGRHEMARRRFHGILTTSAVQQGAYLAVLLRASAYSPALAHVVKYHMSLETKKQGPGGMHAYSSIDLRVSPLVNDSVLSILSRYCRGIRVLTFAKSNAKVSDKALAALLGACKTSLEVLDLANCSLQDPSVGAIVSHCSNLTSLTLWSKISPLAFNQLKFLKNITKFTLVGCKSVEERPFIAMCKQWSKQLTHLDVSSSPNLTNRCLHAIAQYLQQLQSLKIGDCPDISDEGVESLVACTQLNTISLANNVLVSNQCLAKLFEKLAFVEVDITRLELRNSAMALLAANCKSLRYLDLSNVNKVTDSALSQLARGGSSLVKLYLSNTKATATSVGLFAEHHPRLELLMLDGCLYVDDSALQALWSCTRLRTLGLRGNDNITDKGVLDLARSCCSLRTINVHNCKRLTGSCLQVLQSVDPHSPVNLHGV